MSKPCAYLVALIATSINHIWITATSEAAALKRAEQLWRDDNRLFTPKGGEIDSVMILETQQVHS
jgi:hypothetical protein